MAIPPHTDRNTALLVLLLCTTYVMTQLPGEQLVTLGALAPVLQLLAQVILHNGNRDTNR